MFLLVPPNASARSPDSATGSEISGRQLRAGRVDRQVGLREVDENYRKSILIPMGHIPRRLRRKSMISDYVKNQDRTTRSYTRTGSLLSSEIPRRKRRGSFICRLTGTPRRLTKSGPTRCAITKPGLTTANRLECLAMANTNPREG